MEKSDGTALVLIELVNLVILMVVATFHYQKCIIMC